MNTDLECFRLLDQARRQRVQAREFRQLLAGARGAGATDFLGGIAADLEESARTLEARVADGRCCAGRSQSDVNRPQMLHA